MVSDGEIANHIVEAVNEAFARRPRRPAYHSENREEGWKVKSNKLDGADARVELICTNAEALRFAITDLAPGRDYEKQNKKTVVFPRKLLKR